jgi:hypothetical protein
LVFLLLFVVGAAAALYVLERAGPEGRDRARLVLYGNLLAALGMGLLVSIVTRSRPHGLPDLPVSLVTRAWHNPNLESRWFEVPLAGNLLVLYAGILLFLLASVGIGLVISSFAVS